jgi:hypothetical protein
MEKKKNPISISKIQDILKQRELEFIDPLVDINTAKTRASFRKYRLPLTKYIEKLPKKKQYKIRLSPKKRSSPKKEVRKSPSKKKNWTKIVDQKIDILIEKISILKDIATTLSKSKKENTIDFLDGLKDQIEDFQKDTI